MSVDTEEVAEYCIWADGKEWALDPERVILNVDEDGDTCGYTVTTSDGVFHLTQRDDFGWNLSSDDGQHVGSYGFTDPIWVFQQLLRIPLRDTRIWMGGQFYKETFDTWLGKVDTVPVPMGELLIGQQFVGGTGVVYEVIDGGWDNIPALLSDDEHEQRLTKPAVNLNDHGFLYVRKLGAAHEWNESQQCWTDEGFFSYQHDTLMDLIVEVWPTDNETGA